MPIRFVTAITVLCFCLNSSDAQVNWLPNSNGNWEVPSNWSGGAVPSQNDNVAINVGGQTVREIEIGSSIPSIRTLQCEERLLVTGGDLAISHGGYINGGLSFQDNSQRLTVNGGPFTVSGPVNLNQAIMTATNGAQLDLSTAQEYTAGPINFFSPQRGFFAADSSTILLSGITEFTGGTSFVTSALEAKGGSVIDLSNLNEVIDGMIRIEAEDAGSLINLSSLTLFNGSGVSSLSATQGGEIRLSQDANTDLSFQNVGITFDPSGTINSTRITQFNGGTITSNGVDKVLNITSSVSASYIANEAILDLATLTGAFNNETLFDTKVVRANGNSSFINLENVTSIESFFANFFFEAIDGGSIDMQSTTSIVDFRNGNVQIRATGAGSEINLTALEELRGAPSFLEPAIIAENGGAILLNPNSPVLLTNVSTNVREGSTLTANSIILIADGSFSTTSGLGTILANVSNQSGRVLPGDSNNQTGTLTVNGNFSQSGDGEFFAQIQGTQQGEFDQLDVSGDVSIAGELTINNDIVLSPGIEVTIVKVGGTLSGMFSGLPQDAVVFSQSGLDLQIDYSGGDGNDISLYVFDPNPEPVDIQPEIINTTRGQLVAGGLSEIGNDDNSDYSIQRRANDILPRTEFIVEATCPLSSVDAMTVTISGSVFSRSQIIQSISLYDFNLAAWEEVDARAATRFVDSVATIDVSGNVERFVEPASRTIRARVRYAGSAPRTRFSSNTDQFIWTVQ